MIKLLHAADFHLDSAFSALSAEQAAQRRAEQRFALELLAEAAQGCDLLLLAGDLFDGAHIYRDTLDALHRFFASVRAEVFITPGNHDCLTVGSPYLTEEWGKNVHIFSRSAIERIRLERPRCDVYGAAFTAAEMPALLRGFRAADPQVVNLMVLHGELQPFSSYDPITPEDIAASGLDYLALGHIHTGAVRKFEKTTCAWPGCLMGRGFDECGEKGAYRVEIDETGCSVQFVPIRTRRYEILSVEAGDDPLAAIRAALPADTKEDCYRILLTGASDGINPDEIERALSDSFFSLSVLDRTYPRRELWASAGEDTLRGHCIAELKAQYDSAEESQKPVVALAARLVTALMDGRESPI